MFSDQVRFSARTNATNKISDTTSTNILLYTSTFIVRFLSVLLNRKNTIYPRKHIMNRARISAHWISCLRCECGGGRGLKRQKWRFIYTQRKSRVFAHSRPRIHTQEYIYLYTI